MGDATTGAVRHSQVFAARSDSIRIARRFAADAVGHLGPEPCQSIVLMVSELATNSVRHARSEFRIAIEFDDDQVRVEVHDEGAGSPALQSPGPESTSGRGLLIVDHLADEWGVESGSKGKTVWFVLRLPSRRVDPVLR